MEKENYLEKAIEWAKKKSTDSIQVNREEYEPPKVFKNRTTGEEVQADLSFSSEDGVVSFVDIAMKSDSSQKLVTRWKLLSLMASLKNGKLYLLTPKGHKMFTQKLIDQYKIDATIYSI